MRKNLATSPTDSEISGIENISTFTGTSTYSESEGEGSKGEERSPSSGLSHRIHTESCLDNFVPTQLVNAKYIPRVLYKVACSEWKSREGPAQFRQKNPKSKGKDIQVIIEQMERAGVYDSEVMGPRPKKSKVDKESIKSDKTSEPNSDNCTAEMAPKSKVQ